MLSSSAARLFTTAAILGTTLMISNVRVSAQDMPPTLVVTDQVESMEFHNQITLIGRTEARSYSKIIAEVSGRVIRIDAAEGNAIKKGQPLVSIDPDQIALDLEAKEADVLRAETQLSLAKSNLKRTEDLYNQKLVREITRDSATAWVAIAEADHTRLDAERKRLALDLEHCTIRAPYSGFTLRRAVDIGEWVTEGTPVFEMVDLSEMKVQVDLPERYFGRLAIGSDVSVAVSGDSVTMFTGTVTGIARQAVEATHTFPVIVTIKDTNGRMGGGKLVRATLTMDDTFTSLAVSKDAIVRQGAQTMIYTVADGKAAPIPVMTSSTEGNMIAIQGEGLQAGMPVIVRGNERVFPGSPVRIAEDSASTQANAAKSSEGTAD